MKQPLSRALRSVGLEIVDVAARLSVDPKTVDRWIGGRLPYPRHRAALVTLTGWSERDLWPGIDAREQAASDNGEVLVTYAQRCTVPMETWRKLFARAEHDIGILGYSSLFLAEDAGVVAILRDKARAGVRVRIALGDTKGAQVAQRGTDEGIHSAMPARVGNALVLFDSLTSEPGVSLRLHDTVLYNSIYRVDNELMVNTHAYGCAASRSPVLHLRQATGDGMAATYAISFERVWSVAQESRAHPTNRPEIAATSASG